MTNEQLNAIVEAAKARQDEITPAPWVSDGRILIDGDVPHVHGIVGGEDGSSDVVTWGESHTELIAIRYANYGLITAAPDLNEAVVRLAARVDALEAENKRLVDVITEHARDVPWRYAKDRDEADEIAGRYARAKHDNYMKYTNDEE